MKNFRIKGRSLFVQGFNAMKQPWATSTLSDSCRSRSVRELLQNPTNLEQEAAVTSI